MIFKWKQDREKLSGRIRNLDALPRGTGGKYLSMIEGQEEGVFIAKGWHHKKPKLGAGEHLVSF